MSTTVRVAAAACLSSALLLTACGGSGSGSSATSSAAASPSKPASQLQGLSAEQVLEKAKAATASAKSLRYTADGTTGDQAVAFDVRADKARGAIATVNFGGEEIKIIQNLEDVYIGGDNEMVAGLVDLAGGKDAAGKWLKTSADNPSLSSVLEIADPAKLSAQFLELEPGQKAALGTPKTVAGQQTVAVVVSGGKAGGGTLYVAAEGTPYPLLIESADPNGDKGTITFSDFDKPVDIKVPDAKDVIVTPGS